MKMIHYVPSEHLSSCGFSRNRLGLGASGAVHRAGTETRRPAALDELQTPDHR